MKTSKKIILGILSIIVAIVIIVAIYWYSMPSEQRNMMLFMVSSSESYDNYEEYQVINRNDEALVPSTFNPIIASSTEGNNSVNIMAVTEMVQNENSTMLKKGMTETIGVKDYTGWYVLADEGAQEGENPYGPSPLSYYTSGLAANLHTQIIKAAEVKGVELDSVKVEVSNTFRWDEMMQEDGTGHLDVTNTNIIIESNESEDVIEEIKEMAISSWTAGEAIRNETVIEPTLVVNGNNFDTYSANPGTSLSDESYDSDRKLSFVTDVPKFPEYLEIEEKEEESMSIFSMFSMFNEMANTEFKIYAIAEDTGNSERPYLTKITVSTPTDETWEIYSDEFMNEDDTPLAPTSLEYFTVGTSLCLTSQTTLVSGMLGLDYTDYRVEQQIDYRQENVNSVEMAGYTDTVHSYVIIESDESEERLEEFYNRSLSLCFAGEGLKNATEMNTNVYLNGSKLNK